MGPESRDFRLIFAATVLNAVAGTISGLALPLTAAVHLGAGPTQMGLLAAAELLPFALFSLPAGSWIDRSRKKHLGVAFNVLAAAAALAVPVAFAGGFLSLALLYGVGFVVGTCSVIGGSATQVQLVRLAGREALLTANARLASFQSAIALVGPAVAALLIDRIGAPFTLATNALIFGAAALAVGAIRLREEPPATARAPWWQEARDGLRLVRRHPLLRALAFFGALWLMLLGGFNAQFVLFSTREAGLSAAQLAFVTGCGAAGAFLASLAARRFERNRGTRSVLLAGYLLSAVTMGLYPLAAALGPATLFYAAAVKLALDFGVTLYTVNYLALRQRITPEAMLGRVTTTMRGLAVSAAPVGALAWGLAAEGVGIGPAMGLISACGILLWMAASRRLPATAPAEDPVAGQAIRGGTVDLSQSAPN